MRRSKLSVQESKNIYNMKGEEDIEGPVDGGSVAATSG